MRMGTMPARAATRLQPRGGGLAGAVRRDGGGSSMKWSKLKQQVESMFAESVRGRVALWTTRYEKAHDRFGRSWITVDGREIVSRFGCGVISQARQLAGPVKSFPCRRGSLRRPEILFRAAGATSATREAAGGRRAGKERVVN